MTDLPKVLSAKQLLVHKDIKDYKEMRFERVGEHIPLGLKQNRYFAPGLPCSRTEIGGGSQILKSTSLDQKTIIWHFSHTCSCSLSVLFTYPSIDDDSCFCIITSKSAIRFDESLSVVAWNDCFCDSNCLITGWKKSFSSLLRLSRAVVTCCRSSK